VNRQRFTATQNPTTGALSNISLSNQTSGPLPGERGWKDTAPSYPGEVLRVLAKFELPGKYVWHCHILSHEDNEMMRPIFVGDGIPGMRNDVSHTNGSNPESITLFQNVPNPFSDHTVIDYQVPSTGYVTLKVYDMTGKLVETLVDEVRYSGTYSTMVKSYAWESGVYMYVLTTNGETISRRMVHN
jgi:spore coat protein A